MDEILKFLGNHATFYLATMEGNRPRVRPFGFAMEFDNKLYLCTGNQKKVYAQLKKDPACELCAMNSDGEWLRLSGKAVFDNNPAAKKKAFDVSPSLKEIYGAPDNPTFEVFYLIGIEAYVFSLTSEPRKIV